MEETQVEHPETFDVSGTTMDITYARVAAWESLRLILGSDPEEAWRLMGMRYALAEVRGETVVHWGASFARTQD
jgi:hypothetical protein